MNKILAYIFLGVGFVLIIFGFVSYETATSDFAIAMNEESTDVALWLAISGLLASITGAFGLATEEQK